MNNHQLVNISTSTIFRTILILLFFVFLYLISDILIMVLASIIIAIAVNGPADWLSRHRVPRTLAVVFIYLAFSLFLAASIIMVFPPLANQLKQLTSYLPELVGKLNLSVQEIWGRYR